MFVHSVYYSLLLWATHILLHCINCTEPHSIAAHCTVLHWTAVQLIVCGLK